jgi:hypothetical protein
MGRTDSNEVKVLIHAPLMPRDKSNSGPTQQTDAPMAATTAPMFVHDFFSSVAMSYPEIKF